MQICYTLPDLALIGDVSAVTFGAVGTPIIVGLTQGTGREWTNPADAEQMTDVALQAAGTDVSNIADGPRASVRMSNWSLGLKVAQAIDMECIIHVCMRDRNLLESAWASGDAPWRIW